MKEYRCKFCHKLLFKINKESGLRVEELEGAVTIFDNVEAEAKCPKCKKINRFSI